LFNLHSHEYFFQLLDINTVSTNFFSRAYHSRVYFQEQTKYISCDPYRFAFFGALIDTGIIADGIQFIQILWSGNEFLFGPLIFLAINQQVSKPVKHVFIHFYVFILMKALVIITVVLPAILEALPEWFKLALSIILCLHGLIYTSFCLYQLYNKPKNKPFKEIRWLRLLVWMFLAAWIFALSSKLSKPFDSFLSINLFYIVYCTVLIIVYYLSFIVTDRIFPLLPDKERIHNKPSGFQEISANSVSDAIHTINTIRAERPLEEAASSPLQNISEEIEEKPEKNEAVKAVRKYSKSSLTKCQIERYKYAINSFFDKGQPYLDIDFSFRQLSQILNISTHQLSQTFNEGFGKTYPQLVKELRIEEAVKRLQDEKYAHLSIYGIALDCGFNSKSAFNQAFKEITAFTPTGFKKAKKLL
jgi:AraC-like DNA-binding protein